MARVYIIGGGGSGKTALSRLLGEALKCPVAHLDDALSFLWRGSLPPEERYARADVVLRELAAGDQWVIEGNFPGWIDEVAERADVVVWLDVSFRVAAWRIVKRHILADLRRNNPHPGYRNLWRFLRNKRRYYADTDETYRARLAKNPDRWSGVGYGRAAVATHARDYSAADSTRLVHITGGSPNQIARTVLTCGRALTRATPTC